MNTKMNGAERSRQHLTRHLGPLMSTSVPQPHAGWIRATRTALGMNAAQLAARIGVSRSLVSRFEAGERSGTIKLDTMRRAAEAMDCTLVYAFVPKGGSYDSILEKQIQRLVSDQSDRVAQTMSLEGQAPDSIAAGRIRDQIASDIAGSGQVWSS